jgi:hypothetical protein
LEHLLTRHDIRGRRWQKAGELWIMRSFIICMLHQNTIRAIKLRMLSWVGHVACMEEMKNAYNMEDLGIDGRIMLEWILGK